MIIFPAIDLKDGQCVRLEKGDFTKKKVYSDNPLEIAKIFESQGATWLHIIDLDGAKTGENQNLEVIERIKKQTNLKIQVGGGIRTKKDIETMLTIGADRVILGTMAIEQINELETIIQNYPNRIIVSIDSLNNQVTMNGWQTNSNFTTLELAKLLERKGVKTIVYTDISKDGMMSGPNVEDYITLKEQTNLQVIASGGVTTCEDVAKLKQLNLYGAIIGKAIYEGSISVMEAIIC